MTAPEFDAYLHAQITMTGELTRQIGIKPE